MKLNKACVSGLTLCFAAILLGIITNGGIHTIVNFWHIPSLLVTVGGSLFAVLITADSFSDFVLGLKGFGYAMKKEDTNLDELVNSIYEMSDIARKEGLLSLEGRSISDNYLSKGIGLVVDGTDGDLIRDIMQAEMNHRYENERKQVRFWQDFGAYAPAWGMVGTLIGLINMMKMMGTDSSSIGAGMSLALITTLYGSLIANWICIPIARKLEKKSDQETLKREIIIEGVLSIQAGENTRIIKEKMNAIMDVEVKRVELGVE